MYCADNQCAHYLLVCTFTCTGQTCNVHVYIILYICLSDFDSPYQWQHSVEPHPPNLRTKGNHSRQQKQCFGICTPRASTKTKQARALADAAHFVWLEAASGVVRYPTKTVSSGGSSSSGSKKKKEKLKNELNIKKK